MFDIIPYAMRVFCIYVYYSIYVKEALVCQRRTVEYQAFYKG